MLREQVEQMIERHRRCYEVEVIISYGIVRSVSKTYKHLDKKSASQLLKQAMNFDFVKEVTVKARKVVDGKFQVLKKVWTQSKEKVDAYHHRWLTKSKSDQAQLLADYTRLNAIKCLQNLDVKTEYYVRKQITKRKRQRIEIWLDDHPGREVVDGEWTYYMKNGKLKRRHTL